MVNIIQAVFSVLTLNWNWAAHDASPVDVKPAKSIAVVGAGSAGLAALKTLLDFPEETRGNWDIVLYEQRRSVGGVWLPDPNTPHPPVLPETPLYPLLHTNTPHPTMTYPGFTFPPGTPLYPSHQAVERYHHDFATHFDLWDHIRLNHTVVASAWDGTPTAGHWNVTLRDHLNETIQRQFDHVIVANGHNHYPHIPHFRGQESWLANTPASGPKREILHSIFYREPERYANRSVVVVGSGASGRDAAQQVARHAREVYQSIREKGEFYESPPAPVVEKPEISHFTPDAIVFEDGSIVPDVDALILGTGYELRVPFLENSGSVKLDPTANSNKSTNGGLVTNLRYLFPLHQHIVSLCPSWPQSALTFISLPIIISNCPSDIAQSLYAAHLIATPELFPPREELLADLARHEEDLREHGWDPYYVGHRLVGNGTRFDYQDDVVEYLKERGAIPRDDKRYVEGWRRDAGDYAYLKRAWTRVEALGAQEEWLNGVATEAEWADLMYRLNEWQKKWEERDKF